MERAESSKPRTYQPSSRKTRTAAAFALAGLTPLSVPALADPIAFTNIAADPAMNLNYERARSESYAV